MVQNNISKSDRKLIAHSLIVNIFFDPYKITPPPTFLQSSFWFICSYSGTTGVSEHFLWQKPAHFNILATHNSPKKVHKIL